ncbi:hypothetical protein G9A89_016242 [Geosiphon pyriformis]|nr:hypothetical protein G9A89_016242 [Geosiphon pyriformis]
MNSEQFHKHYQNLALTKKEQEQCLEQLNIQLYDYCLISCDFQYCNECDLIYNLLLHMIYTIPEEKKPISSCVSELELKFNSNSNSNDDNKNNDFSSIQNGNINNKNLDSDSNPKQYITLLNLSKKQELKWFSDNNEGIMSECIHNTNAGFDLRYFGKDAIKLEPHLHTYIDLKVALEISTITIIQLICKYHITNNIWTKKMLFALTKTIRTNELGKSKFTLKNAA